MNSLEKDMSKMIRSLIGKIPGYNSQSNNPSPLSNATHTNELIVKLCSLAPSPSSDQEKFKLAGKSAEEIKEILEHHFNLNIKDDNPVNRTIFIICCFAYGVSIDCVCKFFMDIAMNLSESEQRLIVPMFTVLLSDGGKVDLEQKLIKMLTTRAVNESSLDDSCSSLANATIAEFLQSPFINRSLASKEDESVDSFLEVIAGAYEDNNGQPDKGLLSEQLKTLEDENANLILKLKSKEDAEVRQLKVKEDLESKVRMLANRQDELLIDKEDLMKKLQDAKSECSKKMNELIEKKNALEKEINDYQIHNEKQESVLAKLCETQVELKNLKNDVKLSHKQCEELRNERNSCEKKMEVLERKLKDKEDVEYKNKRLECKVRELEFMFDHCKSENETLTATVKQLEDERVRIREEKLEAQKIVVEHIPADESEVTTSPIPYEALGFIPESRLRELRDELDVVKNTWIPPNIYMQDRQYIEELRGRLSRMRDRVERSGRDSDREWNEKLCRMGEEIDLLKQKLKTSYDHLKVYEEHAASFKAHYDKKKDSWAKQELSYKQEIELLKEKIKQCEKKLETCSETERIDRIIEQLEATQKQQVGIRRPRRSHRSTNNTPRVDLQEAFEVYCRDRNENYCPRAPATIEPRASFPISIQPIRATRPQVDNHRMRYKPENESPENPSPPKVNIAGLVKVQHEFERLADLMDRNAKRLPHLRSVYPTDETISPGKERALRSGDIGKISKVPIELMKKLALHRQTK
ncbi:hypothetical protein ACOME3_003406 [Neoechinorhynchus agilis]